MRLLTLVNTEMWGGAEGFLWLFCREMCSEGHSVVAVCPARGPVFDRFRELPLTACYQEEMGTAAGRFRGLGSFATYAPRARRRMRELLSRMQTDHGCDVVLCQYPREQCLTAELGSELGYRSVWLIHSRLYYFVHRMVLNPRLGRAMLKADSVSVFSESTKKAMAMDGFPEWKMGALPVAIEIPATPLRRVRDGRQRIGVVCRLHRPKGVQNVLLAAPSVLQVFPDVEFVIAGQGPYRPNLERLARKLKIESSVRFLGFVRNPGEVFSQIDILAHATFDPGDSMPLAILEAGAAGVPVVSTRWGGIPEIVQDGKTGILVPPHDVPALAQALLTLLHDSSLLATMTRCSKPWVEQNFAIPAVAQRILNILERRSDPVHDLAISNHN
jgi:glycosyltransferase involved in cell wall biosynthesis